MWASRLIAEGVLGLEALETGAGLQVRARPSPLIVRQARKTPHCIKQRSRASRQMLLC